MIVNPELYEEGSACIDPSHMQYQALQEDGYSQTMVQNCNSTNFSMDDQQQMLSYPQQDAAAAAAAAAANMELEINQQMGLDLENCYNPNNNGEPHLMQDQNHQPSWETHQVLNFNHYQQIQEMQHNSNNNCSLENTANQYPQTPDLLNLFHLPNCSSSVLPNSSITFTNPTHKSGFFGDLPNTQDTTVGSSSVLYDPMFHLNLPPPPPIFRDLFQSNFPHGYNFSGTRNGALFDGMEDTEGNGEFDAGVLEFSRDLNCLGKGKGGKDVKHFATEKQRRVHLNGKYAVLKNLVPISTKPDRASVVGDAIDYIKELQRTVNELQILVEKKRYSRERLRRHMTEDESVLEVESKNMMKPQGDSDQAYNGNALRSSWLQRKSKNTEVDVRIIDDEVTIKLVQQKRINSLLFVSKVLDELQLDLQHVAGGLIGDFYSFLFNTKICEGSSVYASAIANKLIDVVDREYAASQPTSSY
ncbi:hypothetical protein DCAR_0934061 [Daucus carota subsp. sativus]|uniref:BHLH domain-containing protein n=1 Tax=Daucus carota subsp. sativus TaxID=79200 RepID=A0A175YFI9_DAUCS|nr:PREDICTED: transcription factor bHLH91-like [Daucus carota subsp. sativus]WOH14542.1 hypothetical protein DCAR_0934061 [Daucus carota subsp. sativus]